MNKPFVIFNKKSNKYLSFNHDNLLFVSEVDNVEQATICKSQTNIPEEIIEAIMDGAWSNYPSDNPHLISDDLVDVPVKITIKALPLTI